MYYYNTLAWLGLIEDTVHIQFHMWMLIYRLFYTELSGRVNISPRKCTQFKHPQYNHSDKTNRIYERNLQKETDNRAEH